MGRGLGGPTLCHGPSAAEGTSCCAPRCWQAPRAPTSHRAKLPKHFCFWFPFCLLSSVLGPMTDVPPTSDSTCGSTPSPPKRGPHGSASWSPLVPWSSPVPTPSPALGSGGGGGGWGLCGDRAGGTRHHREHPSSPPGQWSPLWHGGSRHWLAWPWWLALGLPEDDAAELLDEFVIDG